MRSRNRMRLATLAILIGALAVSGRPGIEAATVRVAGVSVSLPGSWDREAGADEGNRNTGRAEVYRHLESGATLVAAGEETYTEVSAAALAGFRRGLIASLARRGHYEVESVALTRFGGSPAYRIGVAVAGDSSRVHHVQYVVCTGATSVWTLSLPEGGGDLRALERGLEDYVRVDRVPSLLVERPAWFCGGMLFALLVASYGLRLGGRNRDVSLEGGLSRTRGRA